MVKGLTMGDEKDFYGFGTNVNLLAYLGFETFLKVCLMERKSVAV